MSSEEFESFIRRFTKAKLEAAKLVTIDDKLFSVQENIIPFLKRRPFPVYAGELMAELKPFRPSLSLLQRLGTISEKAVVVNKRGEWFWICGRDLWAPSIVEIKGKLGKGDLVTVLNNEKECLGYGLVIAEKKAHFKSNRRVIENKLDIGWWLRKKQKKFKHALH